MNKVVDFPVVLVVRVPQVVYILVVTQRLVPMVLLIMEIPQLQFIDKVIDVPLWVIRGAGGGQMSASSPAGAVGRSVPICDDGGVRALSSECEGVIAFREFRSYSRHQRAVGRSPGSQGAFLGAMSEIGAACETDRSTAVSEFRPSATSALDPFCNQQARSLRWLPRGSHSFR